MQSILHLKNMVCQRCVMAVESVIRQNRLAVRRIGLGEVEWEETPSTEDLQKLEKQLNELGFEFVDDKRSRLINQIKTRIVELIHHSEELPKVNLSALLAEELHHDYGYLSKLFSEIEGSTIEKYFIDQRIERVKELLAYGEMNLNEIADHMGYSSVAHLSAQFKKVTGLTPTHFKSIGNQRRRPIDKV